MYIVNVIFKSHFIGSYISFICHVFTCEIHAFLNAPPVGADACPPLCSNWWVTTAYASKTSPVKTKPLGIWLIHDLWTLVLFHDIFVFHFRRRVDIKHEINHLISQLVWPLAWTVFVWLNVLASLVGHPV